MISGLLTLLWALLLLPPAQAAGVPLVTDEATTTGLKELVAGRSGLPEEQLELVPLSEVLTRPAEALGKGVLRRCATSPTGMSTIKTALARAEAALREEDDRSALDQLDLAVAQLGCLSELAEPQVSARIFQLRGVLLGQEDEDAGKSELRTALAFASELSWGVHEPRLGPELVQAVAEEPLPYVVHVSPPKRSSGPWLDGRPVPGVGLDVRKGLHLLQYATPAGIRSGWLVVGGDVRVVLPMAYREPILAALQDPVAQAPVVDLLAAALPDFKAAYVCHAGGLWLVSEVGEKIEVSELIPPPPPEEPEEKGKGKRGKKGRG